MIKIIFDKQTCKIEIQNLFVIQNFSLRYFNYKIESSSKYSLIKCIVLIFWILIINILTIYLILSNVIYALIFKFVKVIIKMIINYIYRYIIN